MTSRFPDTGTLGWYTGGTYNTIGEWSAGTLNTIHLLRCSIQRQRGSSVTGVGGDSVSIGYLVICPMIETVFTLDQKADFVFNGATYPVLTVHNVKNTRTTEIEVKPKGVR